MTKRVIACFVNIVRLLLIKGFTGELWGHASDGEGQHDCALLVHILRQFVCNLCGCVMFAVTS